MKPGIITTISAVLLLLASGTTALCHESYDKITYVSIHKTTKDPKLIHRSPQRDPLCFEGIICDDTLTIYCNKTVDANITITNLDTGDIDTYYVTLDDNGQEFQINDSGEFEISVICSSGVYEGLFII